MTSRDDRTHVPGAEDRHQPGEAPAGGKWTPEDDLGEPEIAEAVGATVDEAIEHALEILGAREDEVEIEVLQEGRRAFLGIGRSQPYRVRVTWREDLDEEVIEEEISEQEIEDDADEPEEEESPAAPSRARETRAPVRPETPAPSFPSRAAEPARPLSPPAPRTPVAPGAESAPRAASAPSPPPAASTPSAPGILSAAERPSLPERAPRPRDLESLPGLARRAQEVTDDLLRRMGIEAEVQAVVRDDEIFVQVESDTDDALLIGRRGETRAALQHIVQRLVTSQEESPCPLLLDVNGYWARRMEKLRQDAFELAQRAARGREEIRTEPLSAQERRVIHRALADDPHVRTESVGSGALKRVAIIPDQAGS